MEQITTNTRILKINHAILTEASTFNHTLFNGLVTSMREHIKDRNAEVEIYIEDFHGNHVNGEETEHLFDSIEALDEWLKYTYPKNF